MIKSAFRDTDTFVGQEYRLKSNVENFANFQQAFLADMSKAEIYNTQEPQLCQNAKTSK